MNQFSSPEKKSPTAPTTGDFNKARYFQGAGNRLGNVSPLPCKSFAEFCATLREAKELSVTAAEFCSLPKKDPQAANDQARAKQVSFFTPATFLSSTRRTENASCCNLVVLDVDDSRDARKILHQLKSPDTIDGLNFVAYSTASSTRDHPRLRIVVSADEIPLTNYPVAVNHVAKCIGLESVTKESKVPVQPMYWPTVFADDLLGLPFEWYERLDGRALNMREIRPEAEASEQAPETIDLVD